MSSRSNPLTPSVEEKIRVRAYELYQKRGGQNGTPEGDWLQAEAELLQSKMGDLPTRATSFKKIRTNTKRTSN